MEMRNEKRQARYYRSTQERRDNYTSRLNMEILRQLISEQVHDRYLDLSPEPSFLFPSVVVHLPHPSTQPSGPETPLRCIPVPSVAQRIAKAKIYASQTSVLCLIVPATHCVSKVSLCSSLRLFAVTDKLPDGLRTAPASPSRRHVCDESAGRPRTQR